MASETWEVVGGELTGGIVVRRGAELSSPKAEDRLATGATVEQLELVGERLRYRRLAGAGPDEGWVSIKLKDKALLRLRTEAQKPAGTGLREDVRALFGPMCVADPIETVLIPDEARLRVATISDIHVDQKQNMKWFEAHLPRKSSSEYNVLILPGDVSDDPAIFSNTLKMFTESFDLVCYTPGNHDIWVRRTGSPSDSMAKFREVLKACSDFGVRFRPVIIRKRSSPDVILVPLLSFYASAWDCEPDLPWCPQEQKDMIGWLDFRAIKWPQLLVDEVCRREGSFHFGKEGSSTSISELFAEINEPWLDQLTQHTAEPMRSVVISYSHYLPRQDAFPEKRFLVDSNLHKVSGSLALERQVRKLQPDVHIFGHTHLTVDVTLEGQRYVQWALGTPQEQKAMSQAVGDTGMLVLYDSGVDVSHLAPTQETFWGRFFQKGTRDPSQMCPAPFVRRLFSQMFKDAKLPYDDDYFQKTPNPGPPIQSYEGLYEKRWRL